MKKCIAVLLTIALLMASLSCSFIVFAANSVDADSFVESVEELNEEETKVEKTLEESVGSRVIVKALQKPSVYGNAEYFKGTYGKHIFQYATEEEALKAVDYYSSLPSVTYAVRDGIVEAQDTPYGEAMLGTQRAKEYIVQSELPVSSVNVAVIDTGIDFSHELFSNNQRIIDSGVNLTNTGDSDTALDDNFHGSVCAELIMYNSCESTTITGYKVLNAKGVGTYLWIASGVEKAVEDGADIINLSLGGESDPIGYDSSAVLDDAVQYAISKGVIVVVAAGNDGVNAKYISPANVEGTITVGAIDQAGNHAYFSNYGDCVDFVAPGVGVFSDYKQDAVDGTSFSAPYVAAEVSILLSVTPNITRDKVVDKLREVSIPYEHLSYHDGFHPIEENKGVKLRPIILILNYELIDDNAIYYSNGMPQVDLIFDDVVREEAPDFSVESGHYIDEEFDLILSSAPDTEIYYTQDESYPTKENGIKYDGSIHLDELQSFRAVAFSDNKAPSFYSAREYKMEYHVPESDFTIIDSQRKTSMGETTYYKNVVTEYRGSRKNIICPDTINGKAVKKFDIKTTNTQLTSLTLPDSCNYLSLTGSTDKYTKGIVSITGNGLTNLIAYGKYYPSLVEINAPNMITLNINKSFVRSLYMPKATSIYAYSSECLKSVYAPSLIVVKGLTASGYFEGCLSLQDFFAPNIKSFGVFAFSECVKLRDFSMEHLEKIESGALNSTYSITKLYCPSLTQINGSDTLTGCHAKFIYAPKLKICSSHIGEKSSYCDSGQIFDFSNYIVKLIVSSEWLEAQQDGEGYDINPLTKERYFYHYHLDIYGTPNTYAEEYANKFNLKFVPLPLMESEPESMRASDSLSVDVLGFNLEYQWYGTNIADNRLGEAIEGANGETFNPDDFGADYDFYYCEIKSSDGDYHKTLVTGDRIRLDVNGDGVIDMADISLLLSMYGEAPAEPFQDFNGDGVIDVSEISLLLKSTVYGTEE